MQGLFSPVRLLSADCPKILAIFCSSPCVLLGRTYRAFLDCSSASPCTNSCSGATSPPSTLTSYTLPPAAALLSCLLLFTLTAMARPRRASRQPCTRPSGTWTSSWAPSPSPSCSGTLLHFSFLLFLIFFGLHL